MRVTIITDASWCDMTQAGGYGYWVACERGRERGGAAFRVRPSSSLIAEMMAMVNGLCQAVRSGLVMAGDRVLIQTDCQAAIDIFSGKTDPHNREELQVLTHMKRALKSSSLVVEYRHVKGHTAGNTPRTYVNNYCDHQARTAMRKLRQNIKEGKV